MWLNKYKCVLWHLEKLKTFVVLRTGNLGGWKIEVGGKRFIEYCFVPFELWTLWIITHSKETTMTTKKPTSSGRARSISYEIPHSNQSIDITRIRYINLAVSSPPPKSALFFINVLPQDIVSGQRSVGPFSSRRTNVLGRCWSELPERLRNQWRLPEGEARDLVAGA